MRVVVAHPMDEDSAQSRVALGEADAYVLSPGHRAAFVVVADLHRLTDPIRKSPPLFASEDVPRP
jgi:hypothetical protein